MTSSMIQQQAIPNSVHSHGRTDEDFINRSLLDQIDTDADTDPVFSSDSEAAGASFRSGMNRGRDFGSSSSQSSVESSGVPYSYQMMQGRSNPPPRSDSPNGQRANLVYASQNDQMVHTPQQMLYNNPNGDLTTEFGAFPGNDAQSSAGFDGPSLRNNSMYGTFGPRGRQSIASSSSVGMVNEQGFNSGQYPGDIFAPQQQQVPNGLRGYELFNEATLKGNAKSMFPGVDPFANNTMMQAQQLNKQMQSQSQQFQLQNLANSQFGNNMMQGPQQTQSQTPFGPHVNPTSNSGLGGPAMTHSNGLGTVSITNQQEEISTIFVVGFPEDMQEREFQNMFTFSSGFEAATLKIPNKDSTAYGSNAPPSGGNANNPPVRGSFQLGQYGGQNDPYNLLNVNQGGVLVDGGRDGPTASWPPIDANDMNNAGGSAQGANQGPPRKQIIGFAKFRTRAEALAARDLLQGRRVDIEKGAVLKAEMAKKNLHTKRGVGPLGAPLSVNVGGQQGAGSGAGPGMNSTNNVNMGSMNENLSAISGMLSPTALNGPEMLGGRERDIGSLGNIGLGGALSRRDRADTIDEEREARRRLGSVGVLTNGLGSMNLQGQRGPRERLEEDERERRRKDREAERTPLRTNPPTFDSFQSAAFNQRGGPLSASGLGSAMLSPSESMSMFPFAGASLFSPQESLSGMSDGWPIPAPGQRLQPRGSIAHQGLPLGISTSFSHSHPSSSLESSPTEANPEPLPGSQFPNSDAQQELTPSSPKASVPLSSQPSMSSLGSRSRPYSPTNDMSPSNSAFGPSLTEQAVQISRAQQIPTKPPSSASSISESRSSNSSLEDDVSRTIGTIDVSTSQMGAMSPQLPSPNSGASSGGGSRTNLSDQNPPINTLYVGNLPTSPVPGNNPNVLEESLRSLFSRCPGYSKLCFRQKSNGPMCFVEFENVNYAARALSDLYGNNLNGLVKGGIRLSYSKNPLGVRTPTNAANGSGLHQAYGSGSFSSLQDALSRQASSNILSLDMNAVRGAMSRRDTEVTSPSQYFAASPPPPRFFSPPPPSGFGMSGAQTPGGSGLPRASQGFTGSFSPFGSSTPPEMAPTVFGSDRSDRTDVMSPTLDQSTTPSLENNRN